MVAWRYEISLFELKSISLVRYIIHQSKRNLETFVPPRGHVISSIYYIHLEITDDPCNRIGSQQCDLFTNHTVLNRVIHVLNHVISVLNRSIFALFLFQLQNEM